MKDIVRPLHVHCDRCGIPIHADAVHFDWQRERGKTHRHLCDACFKVDRSYTKRVGGSS